ncbi:MAG: M48 family metallopeptidase [Ruminococcus sp.]|nr:M48 family metallopeptidase [Ruminococcus sp.]
MYKRRKIFMEREITLGGQQISYELTYKAVKNINVRIKPGGKISVSAGRNVSVSYIDDFLREKSDCIIKALDRSRADEGMRDKGNSYSDGGEIYYLGGKLTLRIEKAPSCMAVRDGNELIVCTSSSESSRIQAVVEAWYDAQCRKILGSIGRRVYEKSFMSLVPREPVYSYKKMKTLWGSCNPVRCRMSINRELIKYSEELIEFVFYHEYTHFIHPDHSQAFYDFMSSVLPDHRKRQQKLKKDALLIRT